MSDVTAQSLLHGVFHQCDVVANRVEGKIVHLDGILDVTRVGGTQTAKVITIISRTPQQASESVPLRLGARSALGVVADLSALHDGRSERRLTVRWERGEKRIDRESTSRFAEDCHFFGRATEGCNVVLNPFQGKALIVESKVALGYRYLW